ncbi:MAG: alpha/beta hydrolase [Ahrensia sp.]|nr:alpha/beta hydrolase [Ahrensia sp.]
MDLIDLIDWDDAFDNSGYIDGADAYFDIWAQKSKAARADLIGEIDVIYGAHPREKFDLFSPDDEPKGLVIFIHGGYWQRLDKSYFSHLARGPVTAGYTVAIVSYPLAPEVRIAQITRSIARAVDHSASLVDGPIYLIGHSAGGHLVTRMICGSALLKVSTQARLKKIVSVSGVYDLRPLCQTKMNAILRLNADEAASESPAMLEPSTNLDTCFWVGADERPEFLRQTRLITEKWQRKGVPVNAVYDTGKHHFNVIDGLEHSQSPLLAELLF